MKLAHIALWTRDLEASARFWATYFSATIGARYDSQNRPGFASRFVELPDDGLQIEIMEGPWVTQGPDEVCGWAHVAFCVGAPDRVDALAQRFQRDGLLVSAPRRTGDGFYEAVIRAPDGTLIELVAS